jgi:hypothetical protein
VLAQLAAHVLGRELASAQVDAAAADEAACGERRRLAERRRRLRVRQSGRGQRDRLHRLSQRTAEPFGGAFGQRAVAAHAYCVRRGETRRPEARQCALQLLLQLGRHAGHVLDAERNRARHHGVTGAQEAQVGMVVGHVDEQHRAFLAQLGQQVDHAVERGGAGRELARGQTGVVELDNRRRHVLAHDGRDEHAHHALVLIDRLVVDDRVARLVGQERLELEGQHLRDPLARRRR